MKATTNETERRLGIRVDTDTFERLQFAMPRLKQEARKRGERATQQTFVEEAIEMLLDFKERKGDEMLLAVEEILVLGNARHRRVLEMQVRELLEEVQAAAKGKS